MKVAIFGGSFNPPTVAHMQMLQALVEDETIWKVLVVPCGERPDKPLAAGEHRLNLLRILIKDTLGIDSCEFRHDSKDPFVCPSKVILDDYELSFYKRMMPTSNLIMRYQQLFPQHLFAFAIGTDLLTSISTWQLFEEFLKHQHFIVFKRTGHVPKPNEYELDDAKILETNVKPVSSTLCRNLMHEYYNLRCSDCPQAQETQRRILEVVSPRVLNYVLEHCLFKS